MLVHLPHKSVLKLTGTKARTFLQGIITQNVDFVGRDTAIYSALLSPQGKMVADFTLHGEDDLYLVTDSVCAEDLVKRLNMYKLRADVTITMASDLGVGASLIGQPAAPQGWMSYPDPRHPKAPWIVIAPEQDFAIHAIGMVDEYDIKRIGLGLTDGSRDWVVNKTLPLEIWADALNGVDFNKGCYVGQEVTARTHYRKAIKKRVMIASALLPVALPPHSPIMAGDKEIGTLLSTSGPQGLALIRTAFWDNSVAAGEAILSGETPLVLQYPSYAPAEATEPSAEVQSET